jgi:phage replication-related protein YjqB (UPF0714/DUF867 family)
MTTASRTSHPELRLIVDEDSPDDRAMLSYNAQGIPDSDVPNGHIREHCTAHRTRIATIRRGKGQQVRVERYAADGVQLLDVALYTIIDVHDGEPDVVAIGYKDPESTNHDLRDRLGLSSIYPFPCKINAVVPHPTVADDKVEERSEFIERLTDNGRHRGLIAIAPHGGNIERHTDEQARAVRDRLAQKCVSVWFCRGYKLGGGAFDRWHITSRDISEESFPKLKTVMRERHFDYAVAFHGWEHDSICIGGSAPRELKKEIKAAVLKVTSGIVVSTDDEGTCPEDFGGTDPKNIVNRLGTSGIQLEQSIDARSRFGIAIAHAVADVIGPRLDVCTAPVFEASNAWIAAMQQVRDSVLAALLIPMAWAPTVPCRIKRLLFRIRNARRGNADPCIEL